MKRKSQYRARIFLVLLTVLVLACAMVPASPAADPGNAARISTLTTAPDLNRSGSSLANMTIPPEYQNTAAPIVVFKAEVTASSLPGPRDMAYGPSVIGFSMDPASLAITVLVIAIIIAGLFLYFRKQKKEN